MDGYGLILLGFVEWNSLDCGISNTLAMEIPQSYNKPSALLSVVGRGE